MGMRRLISLGVLKGSLHCLLAWNVADTVEPNWSRRGQYNHALPASCLHGSAVGRPRCVLEETRWVRHLWRRGQPSTGRVVSCCAAVRLPIHRVDGTRPVQRTRNNSVFTLLCEVSVYDFLAKPVCGVLIREAPLCTAVVFFTLFGSSTGGWPSPIPSRCITLFELPVARYANRPRQPSRRSHGSPCTPLPVQPGSARYAPELPFAALEIKSRLLARSTAAGSKIAAGRPSR